MPTREPDDDGLNMEEAYFRFLADITASLSSLPELMHALDSLVDALNKYAVLDERMIRLSEQNGETLVRMTAAIELLVAYHASNVPPSERQEAGNGHYQ